MTDFGFEDLIAPILHELEELRDVIGSEAEPLGLYLRPELCGARVPNRWVPMVQAGVTDLGMLLAADEQEDPLHEDPLRIQLAFEMGDLCWSDRIQDPEAFEEDKAFRQIAPSQGEMMNAKQQESIDELLRWSEENGDV